MKQTDAEHTMDGWLDRGRSARIANHALVVVDVINDFKHEDGEALLASFRRCAGRIEEALGQARGVGVPVIYANDNWGVWDGNACRLVDGAVRQGLGGELVARLAPRDGDRFIVKPRYSAFDQTPLELLLAGLDVHSIALAGAATEMCVTHTAIAAHQLDIDVVVLPDACAEVDPEAAEIALGYLASLGIQLRQTNEVFQPSGLRPSVCGGRLGV